MTIRKAMVSFALGLMDLEPFGIALLEGLDVVDYE
jgi:hypothetical protein